MQIDVKNLTFNYGQNSKATSSVALDNISLTINEGEFFGIIGHTGSGKSTFVQHLNGLIKLNKNSGEIKIGEFDLGDKNCDFKALRSKLGMVFQYPEYQLFAETVFEDVAFGIKNFMPTVTEEEKEKMVRTALETVGLNYERVKDMSPFELSGGQKRRVAIAGVIVTKPEVLVLDEPVAGLDPVGKRDFIALLKKLHASFVKTIILVSHDMDLVADNCTQVAVFAKGKIAKVGSPEEVFGDYEEIKNMGLDLPLTAYLKNQLEKQGVKIGGKLSVEEFINAVKSYGKGGKV
ncbi:MAG: energy-coupling factor transporter ATPase [Clostridiales bacterium]|nr:energy-coupling factor transporter ATPase [Clostridiales bacterium]